MGRPKRATAAKNESQEDTKKVKGGLAVGDQLPEFELETDEEKTVSSADMVKDNGIVLFCYPKANTKGCTSQAVGLSEKAKELAEAGYKVFGISADKPKSQANWRKKEGLEFNLLCDPSHEVLGKLGFMKGSKINRSHIVVEKGGKVLDVQYGITPKNSVKDAVEFCLEHKGEPAAAEQAEEAAAAGEEAEAAEDKEEGGKEEAEGAEAEGDKADEAAAEEKKDEAAPMETDAAAAEEKEEPPAKEEEEEAKPDEEPPAEEEEEPPAKEEEPAKEEQQQPEQPAEEAAAAEQPAAEEQQSAEQKADEEPAAAEAPAAAAAAEEAPKEEPAAAAAATEEEPAKAEAAA